MSPAGATGGGGRAWPRWTARLRLTLWYGGLFVLAGLVLVGTSYLLVRQRLLPSGGGAAGKAVCVQPGGCQTLPGGAGAPAADPDRSMVITGEQITTFKAAVLADALRTLLGLSPLADTLSRTLDGSQAS